MAERKTYCPMPSWGGPFELWSRNFVARNNWRTAHVLGSDEDALQECALVFARCLNKYRGKIDNHAWFMALFKRAVFNEWNSLSVRDTRNRDNNMLALEDDAAEDFIANDMASDNWGAISATLRSTGNDIICAMQSIASAPADALAILFGAPTADQQREKIRRHKKLEDDFSVECIRRYFEYHMARRGEREGADALASLQMLMQGLA